MARKKAKGNGTGTVYPRKNKQGKITGYLGSYVGLDKKRRYVSGKTKGECERNLRAAMSEADKGLVFDASNAKLTEYLDRWLNDSVRSSVKPITYESYSRLVRVHIVPALGGVKLSKLTPAHLQGFYRDRLDAGLSPRTVQYLHVVLHRALKQALRWELVPRNVSEAVDPPKVSKTEVTLLSPEQARTFLEAAREDRLEALYVLAIHTGLRQGELFALRWDDVDLESGVLRVRGTKTARSRRTVKLSPSASEALRSHLSRQLEEISATGDCYQDRGLVFATDRGTPLNRHNLSRRSFKPLLRKAELPEIRFHDLRHTCATILLKAGQHPKFVQEMLGHATIAITLDTYSHVLPGMSDGLANAMEDALT